MNDPWLRLAWVGMHPDRLRGLLETLRTPEAVLAAIEAGRIEVPAHARAAAVRPAGERWTELAAMGVSFRTPLDDGWPAPLEEVVDRPPFLFQRGSIPTAPMVAIVGTRRCTRYGRDLAAAYGAAVSRAGWVVISGLARGVDGEAHRGSLEGPTPGVAVLGCGIDRWYPTTHTALGEALLATGGAVVSEYPPGTPPTGWRFPPRNRIISGMAGAVVVVEAGVRGGALITAHRALDQDRPVLAVPGDVTRATSEGCNLLIRDGAIPVLGPDDLVEALGLILGPPRRPEKDGGEAVPVTGITVEELALVEGKPVEEMLVELGRRVAEGTVRISQGRVYPG